MDFIDFKAPSFTEEAFVNGEIKEISLNSYIGKWVILFFYPADFTFVCPTELSELAKHYEEFKKENAEIISISTDTVHSHKAWHNTSEIIKQIKFPMLADPTHRVSKEYETLIEDEGVSLRATFLVDPDGVIRAFEFHDNNIGRSVHELLRKLQAARYAREHKGEVCPMNWHPGEKSIKL